jgi:hypothetical protein
MAMAARDAYDESLPEGKRRCHSPEAPNVAAIVSLSGSSPLWGF